MRFTSIFFSLMLFGIVATAQPVLAANTDSSAILEQPENVVSTLVEEAQNTAPSYDGISIDEPTKPPSTLGMFWRGFKESVSLALTLDSNKKAEKAMKFAEERILMAEKDLESDDTSIKERAQKNLERAQTLMKKADKSQEKALKKPNENTERLLKKPRRPSGKTTRNF